VPVAPDIAPDLAPDLAPEVAPAGRRLRFAALGARWDELLLPLGLYLLGVALLTVRIGRHPANAYNWENYASWGVFHFWDGVWPWADMWRLNDGLMTDSGESPLVVLPVWLGWELFGVGMVGLRVPLVLVGALAVPLTWLVGRRLVGEWAAVLGASLMAVSPVFLLYGRTATLVGISLVPALVTIYALLRVLRPEQLSLRVWIGWLAALQVLLVADSYAYSVLRFLWLICLVLFGVELAFRWGEWRRFVPALVLTALVLPAALVLLGRRDGYGWNPKDAVVRYYNGRGEQILRLNEAPEGYRFYLRQTEEERQQGGPEGTAEDLAWRLIRQNAGDYVNLLLDRQTRPAITDYWNPQGRLYPRLLVPFFLLGLLVSLVRFWGPASGVEARALLGIFFGFGLPLFLTSRVHVGRLIFAVPFLFLLVALGVAVLAGVVNRRSSASAPEQPSPPAPLPSAGEGRTARYSLLSPPSSVLSPQSSVLAVAALAAILVGLTAQDAWADYRVVPGPSREWAVAQTMVGQAAAARAAGGAALVAADGVGAEIEAIDGGAYRLLSDDEYRYVNLAEGGDALPVPAGDDRPPLYVARVLERLRSGTMPGLCTNLYFVRPDAEDAFLEAMDGGRPAGCAAPVKYVLLPG
jgi:hypothetical protein